GAFELRVGGADCTTGTIVDSGPYAGQPATDVSSVAAAQLAEGSNTLRLCLSDAAGNRGQAATTLNKDTTAPNTSIGLNPPSLTKSTAAKFEFSGSDGVGSGVVSFECRRDGGAWAACTSPREYTGLAEGAHTFEVKAVDQAGNVDGSAASFNWTVDTIAPETTITLKPASLTNSAAAKFEFSGSDGAGSGVVSFECRLDSGVWGACPSPKEYTGLGQGAHSFEVKAVDNAGNTDATPASAGWTIELTTPQPAIDSLSKTLLKAGETSNVTWHADENGAFELRVGGVDCDSGTILTSGTYANQPTAQVSNVTAAQLQEGANTLRLCLTDTAGNRGQTTATLSKDTEGPETAITLKPTVLAKSTGAKFGFSGSDGIGSGIASFECRRDGGAWAACTSPKQYSNLSEGAHSFEVKAIDQAGNVDGTPATFSWTIDSDAPDTTIQAKPPTATTNTAATFTFSGSDPGGSGVASFECRRDGAVWAVCTSPKEYTGLAEGAHVFEVKAVDLAGNVDPIPASFDWQVDNTPPALQIVSGPSGLTNNPTPTFGFSSEPGVSFECSIDEGTSAFGPCSGATSHMSASPLSEGPHTFRVRATDAAANQSTATRNFIVDTTATPTPELTVTAPVSPANENNPRIFGTAPANTTVRLYTSADCAGSPVATASAAELAAGIVVPVPDDSTTTFRATATAAAESTSGCSEQRAYVEDSTAPETTFVASPPPATTSTSASFFFAAGEPGSSFECRVETGAFDACTSPVSFADLTVGGHSFSVRATDAAGNVDSTPAERSWTVESPPSSLPSGCGAGSTAATTAAQVRSAVQAGKNTCVTADVGNVDLSNLGARAVIVSTSGGSMGEVDLVSTTDLTIAGARFRSIEMRSSHRTRLLGNTIGGTQANRVPDQLIFMPATNNDVAIEGNDIGWTVADDSGNTGYGCRCYGDLNRLRFVGNRIHDVAADGFQGVGGTDVLIDRNEIGPVGRNPESNEHSDSIQITGNDANLRITNNWIHHQGYFEGEITANAGSTYIHGGSAASLVYENNLIQTAQGRTEICGLGTGGEERSNLTIRRNIWVDGGLAFNGFPGFEWDCDSGTGNTVERNVAVDSDGGLKMSSSPSAATFSANLFGQPSLVTLDAAGNCTSANCNPAGEDPIGYRKPSGVAW
ncbi:MAG: Ig-like domain-containing protein, partial [Solirubrobacterales bacterium]